MNKFLLSIITYSLLIIASACSGSDNINADYVILSTPYGDMKILLYNDTPIHKQNFLRLAKEGRLDSTIFHRVIPNFMIQGGDPNSINAPGGAELGDGEIGDDLPAEIVYPLHFHKRGALAAAREGDNSNPEKKSSGSQFYIVQGEILTTPELDAIEAKRNTRTKNEIFYKIQPHYQDSLQYYQQHGMKEELANLQMHILSLVTEMIEEQGRVFSIPEEHRAVYSTIGGTPHLDGDYTVFGEVVEGLDIIDSIAAVPTDLRRRPLHDIRISLHIE